MRLHCLLRCTFRPFVLCVEVISSWFDFISFWVAQVGRGLLYILSHYCRCSMVQRFGSPSILCWTTNTITNKPDVEKMHSPLPDSSALEAGILEDDRPSQASRLSRVQDNVRNILRTSVFGSVKSSPTTPTHPPALRTNSVHVASICSPTRPEVLPSPTSVATPPARFPQASRGEQRVLFPPTEYQRQVQQMARQSMLFNTRAVAALNHPDLSDPSITDLSQQKEQTRQRSAWTRPKKRSRRTKAAKRAAGSRGVLCLLASLLLAALVATCKSIAYLSVSASLTRISRCLNRHNRDKFDDDVPHLVRPRDLSRHDRFRPLSHSALLHRQTIST